MSKESRPIVLKDGKLSVTKVNKGLSFYTRFYSGNLSDLDENFFNAIDCGEYESESICKNIDLGDLS